MLVFSIISVSGCAGYATVADKQNLVSNHRGTSEFASRDWCESGVIPESFENIPENTMRREALDPAGFSLLNWNIYKGSQENWQQDFRRFSADSDIVTIQEAHLHPEFQAELDDSDLYWDLNVAFKMNDAETGVLIGSSLKPGRLCSVQAIEPLLRTPKTALVTRYPIEGSSEFLLVANIHMINFTLGTDKYQQQISRLIKITQHHDGPMIIAGDFNSWSQGRKEIINNMVTRLGLTAVEYDHDYRLTVFGNLIDNIYFRGLEALSADTEKVESSDHNPMMVTFKFAG